MTVATHLADACRRLLRPIVRMLIRGGLTYREFTDIAKEVYVDVASRDYGKRGRATNAARVSILTGISRHEVGRVRRQLAAAQEREDAASHVAPGSRVLAGWHQDADYLDGDGRPLPLPESGAEPSLTALIKRHGGDTPSGALLGELERVGAIARNDKGLWIVKMRYYMPTQLDPVAIARSGSVLEDLGHTVAHNLHREPTQPSRFEGRATNLGIPSAALPSLRALVEAKGGVLLQDVDDWLTEHKSPAGEHTDRDAIQRLGIGIYWIEDDSDD